VGESSDDDWGDWSAYGRRKGCTVSLRLAAEVLRGPPSTESPAPHARAPPKRRPHSAPVCSRALRSPEPQPEMRVRRGSLRKAAAEGSDKSHRRRRLVERPRVPQEWAPLTPAPPALAERPLTNSDRRRSERRRKAALLGGAESLLAAYIEGRWEAIASLLSGAWRHRHHRLWRACLSAHSGPA